MIFLPALSSPVSHLRPCCSPVQIMFYHKPLAEPSARLGLSLLILKLQQECRISLQSNPCLWNGIVLLENMKQKIHPSLQVVIQINGIPKCFTQVGAINFDQILLMKCLKVALSWHSGGNQTESEPKKRNPVQFFLPGSKTKARVLLLGVWDGAERISWAVGRAAVS